MSLEFFNKIRTFNIQTEYKELSRYLLNLQYHVNYLNDYNIISLYERNIFIGKIYEIVKELNNSYNVEILDYKTEVPKYIDIHMHCTSFILCKWIWSPDSKIMSVTPKMPTSEKNSAFGTKLATFGPRSMPTSISPMMGLTPMILHERPTR